jgi:hypothetical protein
MKRIRSFLPFLLTGLLAAACLSSSEEASQSPPTATGAVTDTATPRSESSDENAWATARYSGEPPGEPPEGVVSWLTDPRSPDKTEDAYAVAGDDFDSNLYERPINEDLAYRHDLDILSADLMFDKLWFYASIQLEDVQPGNETPEACFGIELDVNLDGRGELVIWGKPPFTEAWTRENMTVYGTSTGMVGGPRPLLPDAPWKGDTYDMILFDGLADLEDNAAWVRVSPQDPTVIQIAFSPDLLEEPTRFLWNVWADDGIKDPQQFDYNDIFTRKEAGSPYKWDPEYPPKAISSLDNTCRAPYGFKPVGNVPGGCEVQAIPGPTKEGPTPTFTRIPGPD